VTCRSLKTGVRLLLRHHVGDPGLRGAPCDPDCEGLCSGNRKKMFVRIKS
jgi:hypothetical protein